MNYDPLSEVTDEPLPVDQQIVQNLSEFRKSDKFNDLPGTNNQEERNRLSERLNALLNKLIEGITNNPSKLWVMTEFKQVLESVEVEDTEAREHFGNYLEQIMDILAIESSDGLLDFYL